MQSFEVLTMLLIKTAVAIFVRLESCSVNVEGVETPFCLGHETCRSGHNNEEIKLLLYFFIFPHMSRPTISCQPLLKTIASQ